MINTAPTATARIVFLHPWPNRACLCETTEPVQISSISTYILGETQLWLQTLHKNICLQLILDRPFCGRSRRRETRSRPHCSGKKKKKTFPNDTDHNHHPRSSSQCGDLRPVEYMCLTHRTSLTHCTSSVIHQSLLKVWLKPPDFAAQHSPGVPVEPMK